MEDVFLLTVSWGHGVLAQIHAMKGETPNSVPFVPLLGSWRKVQAVLVEELMNSRSERA